MSTYGSVEYYVVTGTVAAIGTFNAAVETQVNLGYAILDNGPQTDGTNIWQVMMKGGASSFTPDYPVTTATIGAAGAGSFQVAGDATQTFNAGFKFTIIGSTGNNGIWTVKNGGSSFAGGFTTIPVNEAVTDGTADGTILAYAPSVGP